MSKRTAFETRRMSQILAESIAKKGAVGTEETLSKEQAEQMMSQPELSITEKRGKWYVTLTPAEGYVFTKKQIRRRVEGITIVRPHYRALKGKEKRKWGDATRVFPSLELACVYFTYYRASLDEGEGFRLGEVHPRAWKWIAENHVAS